MKHISSVVLSSLSLFACGAAWEYVNDLRLAGELRVVNEGLAHGKKSIHFISII